MGDDLTALGRAVVGTGTDRLDVKSAGFTVLDFSMEAVAANVTQNNVTGSNRGYIHQDFPSWSD